MELCRPGRAGCTSAPPERRKRPRWSMQAEYVRHRMPSILAQAVLHALEGNACP